MTTIDDDMAVVSRMPGDVVCLLSPDGTVRYVSTSVERTLGVSVEQFSHMTLADLIHPDDVEHSTNQWRHVRDHSGEPVLWEARVRHGGTEWRWMEVSAANRLDDPSVGALYLNFRDVTERKEAEEALRVSEHRLRAVLEHSRDVHGLLDPNGSVMWVSPGIEDMLGWRAEDLFGTNGFDLVHPDDLSVALTEFTESLQHEQHDPLELRLAHSDGRWIPIEVAGALWPMDDSDEFGLVINLRDISWRVDTAVAIRESERLFRSLAQSSPTGVYLMLPSGECTYVNERYQEITGYSAADAVGFAWHRIVHPDDRAEVGADGALEEISREPIRLEFRVVRPDGEVRWVAVNTGPMFDDEGVFQGAVGTIEDVTERTEAMRDSQRLTDIFEATHDLVAIADSTGALLYLNQSARGFFGVQPQGSLESFNIMNSFGPEMVERLATEIQPQLDRDGMWYGELPILRADGAIVHHRAQLLVHKNDDGRSEFFSAVLHDISERKEIEHRLAHQAMHDPLTGLPNRALLLDRLDRALRRARRNQRRVAVLFLDLDHFKVVNDSLGHGLGDRLLIAIADRLQAALRPADTVARFGGDEFVVLCEDLVSQQDAVAIAERVNEAVSGPFVIDDVEVFVGVSIGIAFPDDSDADPETLIRDADAAMYQAKDRGRARWVIFDNAMRASAVDRLDIENALRRALDRRELRVYYQPMIELSSGQLTGVEALLRWEHPERGLLLPGDFITVAEETGLIVPIGSWVLDQACRQVQRWQASMPDLPPLVLAVNLSGRQLGHPRLVDDVAAVLAETGIDPSHVDLEITESVLMDDVEMSEETLGRLKKLGVKLVVDDFGTGYSSLSYLRRFPVDVLKVDRSFVDGLGSDPGDSAIVTAVVTLAHALGLHAVAEGVETLEQLSELRRLGCDSAQGFHFARPSTGHCISELLQSNRRW